MRLCAYSLNDRKREYIENPYIGYIRTKCTDNASFNKGQVDIVWK